MQEDITVSGVLFLTDKMVTDGIVEPLKMAEALERMIASNKRLPKKIILEKIRVLKGAPDEE